MELAERLTKIQPSPTLAITALAQQMQQAGKDVVGFGAGEPDFDTPEPIKKAAQKALQEGKTKYSPVAGIAELREAIAHKLKKENGLDFSADEILVTVGGKQAIYNALQALVNPGEQVMFMTPYWVSYYDIAVLAGAQPVPIRTSFENGLKVQPPLLKQALDQAEKKSRVKLFILNSPSNPTGVVYSKDNLVEIANVLKEKPGVYILSDDLYEKILYDGKFYNLAMLAPSLLERMILVNGFSKAYAMTGWRIGYVATKVPGLIKAMAKLQGQSTSGATTFAQYGALAALTGDQSCVDEMKKAFCARRDFIVSALNQMPGIQTHTPQGAFYVFPYFTELAQQEKFRKIVPEGQSQSSTFAEKLLKEKEVAVVPGSAFGDDSGFRISYATSMEKIQKGMERLAHFVQSFY